MTVKIAKKARIPHCGGDSRTFLVVNNAGAVKFGPDMYCNCLLFLKGAGWIWSIVHKSDMQKPLPVAKSSQAWDRMVDTWDADVGNRQQPKRRLKLLRRAG